MDKIKTKEELEKFIDGENGTVKCVKFSAGWCSPCRVLADTINNLTPEETTGVEFCEIDVDEAEEDVLTDYNVRNLPTLLFFKNKELVSRTAGLQTKEALLSMIELLKKK